MSKRTIMPLQERIERTRNSRALSPADAAGRVVNIGKAIISTLLTEREKYMNILPSGPRAIGTYCAVLRSDARESLRRANKSPYEAAFGNSIANTIISLSFLLATVPDRFKRESLIPPTCNDLKMTLGDYLEALIDLSFNKDGTLDSANAEQYRKLKKEFAESFDLSKPLRVAVGSILEQYREARAELDRASHIIRCGTECDSRVKYYEQEREMLEEYRENDYFYEISELNYRADGEENCEETAEIKPVKVEETPVDDLSADDEGISLVSFVLDEDPVSRREREELEARERLIEYDPYGYFLSAAKELPKGEPLDFENNAYGFDRLTNNLLLPSEDHSPEALKAKADQAELSPKFRSLFDEAVTERSVSNTFKGIDAAIDRLYRLLIEPFSAVDIYRFKRHLASC